MSTPRRDLAPPIEEDEEPESESQGEGAPLRQIENNISALLRGDIPIARVTGMRIIHSHLFKITTWQTSRKLLNFTSCSLSYIARNHIRHSTAATTTWLSCWRSQIGKRQRDATLTACVRCIATVTTRIKCRCK